VSDQEKAFAKFPAAEGRGSYHLIDIFTVEAITQSSEPTVCAIFCQGTDRFYQVAILNLQQSGEKDAANWCLSLISRVARLAGGQSEDTRVDLDDLDERIRRANGEPPTGAVEVHGQPV
jgi:hypothetical protein